MGTFLDAKSEETASAKREGSDAKHSKFSSVKSKSADRSNQAPGDVSGLFLNRVMY